MKRIGLLRHAQAEPKAARRDFDRVLSDRGRAEMADMAGQIADAALPFDLALVSPSARTRETWGAAGLPSVPVRYDESIYDAPLETLLGLIDELDDAVAAPVIVGHNPGIEELAATLVAAAADGLPAGYPTAGLAVIAFDIAGWRDFAPGSGRLERFLAPR